MRKAYETVARWVAVTAAIARLEHFGCTDGWIKPASGLFLAPSGPADGVSDRVAALMEEVASAVWLMQAEHAALVERARELLAAARELSLRLRWKRCSPRRIRA